MSMKFENNIGNVLNNIEDELKGDAFGMFLSTTTHKEFYQAMPARTTAFATNILFKPFEYIHRENYSAFVYYKNANYRTEINPFAQARYIEGFGPIAVPRITKQTQNYVNEVIVK